MISSKSRKIQALAEDIRDGKILLPELQRKYVWKSPQVRDLFDSLYRGYPSGQLLIWETKDIPYSRTLSVDDLDEGQRMPQLLLDGQQRLTSLTAIIFGQDLVLRDSRRSIDIAFNIFSEKFEVAGPRQRREPGWISLKNLYTQGAMSILMELDLEDETAEAKKEFYNRINRLDNIRNYQYHINVLESLPYSEVTRIFVRVNSGGTKLNSADLTLAQMSAVWRGITQEITDFQKKITKKYPKLVIDTGILLRTMSVLLTGSARLNQIFKSESRHITVSSLKNVWKRVKQGMEQSIYFLANNCHIDRFELLPTHYILITLTTFFDHFGGELSEEQARGLQHWVFTALIWSRYSGASETAVGQDATSIKGETPLKSLLQSIYDKSGKRPVTERELRDQRKNSPFMLMSYVLARRYKAEDWFNGVLIGPTQDLELHHIFPKAILREKYDLRRDSRTVDQVANLAFLSKRANNKINKTPPGTYLPDIQEGRLRAQTVPNDKGLWTLDKFEEFLLKRRTLLADEINKLLSDISEESKLWVVSESEVIESRVDAIENNLRNVIAHRLTDIRGENAMDLVPAGIRKSIARNESKLVIPNPFESEKYQTFEKKLEFALYSHLIRIIIENWSCFESDFGDPEKFKNETGRIIAARNGLKHNRELTRSEKAGAEASIIWLEECLAKYDLQDESEEE